MTDRRWAWDRYWQYDRLASCMDGGNRSTYDDRMARAWRDFFQELPNQARILDLCTGNGAIAVLASESSRLESKQFQITGIDFADVDPKRFVTKHVEDLRQIEFIAKVNAESLPFLAASQDAVVSQYGIEYTDIERSFSEAVRVLAPRGRLRFGMHAAEGSIVASTHLAIADANFLLEEIDLPGCARRCFEAVIAVERRTGQPEPRAQTRAAEYFAEFRNAIEKMADRVDRATDKEMIRVSGGVLFHAYENRHSFELSPLLDKVEEVRSEISAHRERQLALVSVAMTTDAMGDLADRLLQLGWLDSRWTEQRVGEKLIGYTVEGKKPPTTLDGQS